MSMASKKSNQWEPCESGYLAALCERAKSARRKRRLFRAGAGAALVICGVGLGVWSSGYWSTPRENYFGGIACHEVRENMPAMMAGTLPAEVKVRMEAHLRECSACREMVQKMQNSQAATIAPHDYWACDCPDCRRKFAQAALRRVRWSEPEQAVIAATFPVPALAGH